MSAPDGALQSLLVFEAQPDFGAVDELAAVPDVDVLLLSNPAALDDSATRRSLTDWPAVLIASAAAPSQEVVLVPTTSITR